MCHPTKETFGQYSVSVQQLQIDRPSAHQKYDGLVAA
jgi:hypothetical protein